MTHTNTSFSTSKLGEFHLSEFIRKILDNVLVYWAPSGFVKVFIPLFLSYQKSAVKRSGIPIAVTVVLEMSPAARCESLAAMSRPKKIGLENVWHWFDVPLWHTRQEPCKTDLMPLPAVQQACLVVEVRLDTLLNFIIRQEVNDDILESSARFKILVASAWQDVRTYDWIAEATFLVNTRVSLSLFSVHC